MLSNSIIYDYITFTSKIHSPLSILEFLGLDGISFEPLNGRYGYRDRLHYEGISILYNGREDMGICVEMSGKGCRTWEAYGNSDYDSLFSEILENYSDDSEKRKMNISRLDVAYDDFTGVIDLPLLCFETQKKHFVSNFQHWKCTIGDDGLTVNHGCTSSNVFIRIYDKRAEQKVENLLSHWVRCEIQLRHECALGFIKLKSSIEESYFNVLNEYLRYIVPNDNDDTVTRQDIAPYWLNFIQSAESKSIFSKPAYNYNFDRLYGYVNNQLSGAISTYINIVGVDQFLTDINNSRKGKKLNPKYKTLLEQADANGNAILQYLSEKEDKK